MIRRGRIQMAQNCTNHTVLLRRIMTGTGTKGTPRRCWSGTVTLKVEAVHGLEARERNMTLAVTGN